MKYSDGREVLLGDRVKLGLADTGLVVASIDTNEYGDNHPKEAWEYLGKGVLVEFQQSGLIHYEEPEPDLELVERVMGL